MKEGVKTTVVKIRESMGDMLITENQIIPLGMKVYGVARDTQMNRMFRDIFSLPNPLDLIKVLIEAEKVQVDDYVCKWLDARLKMKPETQ